MRSKGFTLVELLVVVAVVGILAGVSIAVLNPVQFFRQGRDSRRLSDLTTIQSALEQYYAENGNYPGSIPGSGVWVQGSITYLKSMPQDPQGGAYCYNDDSGVNYVICATIEDTPPSDCISPAYGCEVAGACSGNTCNCCLTNPF